MLLPIAEWKGRLMVHHVFRFVTFGGNIFISLLQDQFVCSDYRVFGETRMNDPS